jgi:hypothetical protein
VDRFVVHRIGAALAYSLRCYLKALLQRYSWHSSELWKQTVDPDLVIAEVPSTMFL